jgi:predicted nucleic acid-binding protein
MPAERVFLDTNIWLYAFMQGSETGKRDVALRPISKKTQTTIVSHQVINEVCVNLLRKGGVSEELLQGLIHDFFSRYTPVANDESCLVRASELRRSLSLAYWDSLIVASALGEPLLHPVHGGHAARTGS